MRSKIRNSAVYPLFLLMILLSSCTKKNTDPPTSPKVEYSFLVAGHVYGDPLDNTIGFYPPFKDQFGYIQSLPAIKQAIYTGDVVRSGSSEIQWDSAISDMQTLGINYHVAAGNHDRGSVFLDRFGSYYYSFMEANDLFVILNSNEWNIEGDQKIFLEETLSDIQDVRNIFLFCHELIWWSPDSIFQNVGINYEPHYPGSSNYWAEVDPILQNTEKPVYLFSGDVGATNPSDPYVY